jgi:hypothetical protein
MKRSESMTKTSNGSSTLADQSNIAAVKKARVNDDSQSQFDEDFHDEAGVEEKVENVEDESSEYASGRWIRDRSAENWDVHTKPLVFHWLDIDMVSGQPLRANPAGGSVAGSLEGERPVVFDFD